MISWNPVYFVLFLNLSLVVTETIVRSEIFGQGADDIGVERPCTEIQLAGPSELMCASKFIRESCCGRFRYDDGTCVLFPTNTSDESVWRAAGRQQTNISKTTTETSIGTINSACTRNITDVCPTQAGYIIYNIPSLNTSLCLKSYGAGRSRKEAEAECQIDGGHSILIENAEMHRWIAQELTPKCCCGDTFLWVDGRDLFKNKTYYSHDGVILPWLQWASGSPRDVTYPLIRALCGYGYDLSDTQNSTVVPGAALCQIDAC